MKLSKFLKLVPPNEVICLYYNDSIANFHNKDFEKECPKEARSMMVCSVEHHYLYAGLIIYVK